MAITTLTPEVLYTEIADLARDQGVKNKAGWDGLVDEVMESHTDLGEIDLEGDAEVLRDELCARWVEYKAESSDSLKEEDEEVYDSIDDEDEDEEEKKDLDYGDGDEEI